MGIFDHDQKLDHIINTDGDVISDKRFTEIEIFFPGITPASEENENLGIISSDGSWMLTRSQSTDKDVITSISWSTSTLQRSLDFFIRDNGAFTTTYKSRDKYGLLFLFTIKAMQIEFY